MYLFSGFPPRAVVCSIKFDVILFMLNVCCLCIRTLCTLRNISRIFLCAPLCKSHSLPVLTKIRHIIMNVHVF